MCYFFSKFIANAHGKELVSFIETKVTYCNIEYTTRKLKHLLKSKQPDLFITKQKYRGLFVIGADLEGSKSKQTRAMFSCMGPPAGHLGVRRGRTSDESAHCATRLLDTYQ